MKSIIAELYRSRETLAQTNRRNREADTLVRQADLLSERLKAKLTEEDASMLDELIDCLGKKSAVAAEEHFKEGVKTGLALGLEMTEPF